MVSQFIRHQIACEDLHCVLAICPTASKLQLCRPRNKVFNEALVMACLPSTLLALEDLPSPMVVAGGGGSALSALLVVAGTLLLVQDLPVGPEIVPQGEIANLERAATPAVADSGESIAADPFVASLPTPKRRLLKKTTLGKLAV